MEQFIKCPMYAVVLYLFASRAKRYENVHPEGLLLSRTLKQLP